MKRYRLAVCKGPDCRSRGSDQTFAAIREAVAKLDLSSRCEVYRGGCYGLCHLGPNVVLRETVLGQKKDALSREDFQLLGTPGEFHYAGISPESGARIVAKHVGDGAVAGDLLGPLDLSAKLGHRGKAG